jgi:hypothetical protein
MSDAFRRALRTFIQAFLGSLLASGILSGIAADGVVDLAIFEKAGVSALAAGVIAVLTWAQNALEDAAYIPSLLKAPASDGANPIPEPEPDDWHHQQLRSQAARAQSRGGLT